MCGRLFTMGGSNKPPFSIPKPINRTKYIQPCGAGDNYMVILRIKPKNEYT